MQIKRRNSTAKAAVFPSVAERRSRRYVESVMKLTRFTRFAAFAVVLLAAVPAAADGGWRCDGTNASFFEEVEAAGWTGFGETWDWDTYCKNDNAREIFASGATRRWRKMRPQWSRLAAPKFDQEFYSKVFPAIAFGAIGLIFVIAWGMGVLHRRRKTRVVDLACPSCSAEIPVNLDDPAASGGVFCPTCGTMCSVSADDGDLARAAG